MTEHALRTASAVVVLWSARSVVSRWVKSEATLALRAKTLAPAMIEPCDRPIMFELTQTAELSHWRGSADDPAWKAFVGDVRRVIARDPEAEQPSAAPSAATPWRQPPLPPRIAQQCRAKLFGRDAELQTLTECWAKADGGEGGLVLLGGEPGMGKSRLAAEIAALAHVQGATVMLGSSEEDASPPFRPIGLALKGYVRELSDGLLERHARALTGELARLLPDLRQRTARIPEPMPADPEAERFLMFEAVGDFLSLSAQLAPVLLLFEDLHWAGPSDLLLLKHLVGVATQRRILIVGTFRDSDFSGDAALKKLLADLRREANVTRLSLSGLDESAVTQLLGEALGRRVDSGPSAASAALCRDTAGNPFFVTEMIRSLSESGELGDGALHLPERALAVPESVREVVERRLQRLPEAAVRALGLAAVIGITFSLPLLEHFAAKNAGTAEDDVLDAIDAALAAALIAEVPGEAERFAFKHAIVRTALYETILGARRKRMHRQIAEVLESDAQFRPDATDAALAYHWYAAADAQSFDHAIPYLRRAGETAMAGLAYEEAAEDFRRALEILPDMPEHAALRCDLLLDLGRALRTAGDSNFRATVTSAVAIARQLCDRERLVRAALGSGHPGGLQWANAVDPELVALYDEAIAALGDEEPLTRARLMGKLAAELRVGPERQRRLDLTAQALELARAANDPLTLARVLVTRAFAIEDPTLLEERLAITAESEVLIAEIGHAELGCHAASQRMDALLAAGDAEGALAALKRCEAWAARLNMPFFNYLVRLLKTTWALLRADADAEAQVIATLQAGTELGLPQARTIFGGQLMDLRARAGRSADLIEGNRNLVLAMPHNPTFKVGLLYCLAEAGEQDEAQALLDELVAGGLDLPMDLTWAVWAFMLCEAIGTLQHPAAAALFYSQVDSVSGQVCHVGGTRCDGSFAHSVGTLAAVLGDCDAADAHFAAALEVNDRIGAQVASVRTRRAWAAMLLERGSDGDAAKAAALIDQASAAADELGLVAEAAKLAALSH